MWIRIKFICKECGEESWFEFDNEKTILTEELINKWLVCDDCFEEEE